MRKVRVIIAGFVVCLFWMSMNQAFSQTESTEPLAIQYYQNGEYDKAVVLFEVLYNGNPGPRYYNYYFDCLMQLKDHKTAEKFVAKLVKKYPDDLRYMVDLGYVYQEAGNTKESEKQFQAAVKAVYPDMQGFVDLANNFLLRGLNSWAEQVLMKGKKELRFEPALNLALAEIYLKDNRFSMALREYIEMLDYGGEYMTVVQTQLQDVLALDPDNSKNETFRMELLAMIKKSPEKTLYSELLLWYFIQQKDFSSAFVQAKSLDKRLNEEGQRVYQLGGLAVSNEDYDAAIECFEYVVSLGKYNPYWYSARIEVMDARYLKITKSLTYSPADLEQLEIQYNELLEETGRNASTVILMKNLAHLQGFYLDKIPEATALLQEALAIPGIKPNHMAECKLELADILLMTGDVWEATLLYSQVEKAFKNDPVGAEAKFRNARLSFYIGEFEWSRAQLDVLKAATSKLIANDAMQLALLISDNLGEDSIPLALAMYARADLLLYRNKTNDALVTLDSISRLESYHPLFDEVLYKKAEIFIRKRDYATACKYLKRVYEEFAYDILADDALYKHALISETVFGNKEEAMNLYKQLMENFPGSLYVVDARRRYRDLRGDNMNP